MAHQHGHQHLVRRQRNRDEEDDNVQTVVSVRIVTAVNTYTGKVVWVTQSQESPKTLIAPAERPRTSTSVGGGDAKQSTKPASSAKASATPSPSQSSNDDDDDTTAVGSSLIVATRAPTPSVPSAAAGLASVTASISATASAQASEGGMSGGAKAGLALGILVAVGALLFGVLIFYRRKKNVMARPNDNEKISLNDAPAPLPPQVMSAPASASAPSIRTERTMSTAPRLSLRPVTQFDPAFENRKSGGNLLNVAAAAAPPTPSKDLPDRPTSAWERPGAANTIPAENPFNDPQHSGPPSANPFGNNAALDPMQARLPDSPPNASPLHSSQPSADFANTVPVTTSADIDRVAAANAMASVPAPIEDFPAPPSIHAGSDGIPASPAWTEDFPASPGPAPTGALPVASAVGAAAVVGAVAGARSNSPVPPVNNVHRVQLDFKPSMQDELGLNAGQLVRMLHEYDDGWALCIRMDRSQQGVVPRSCLSKHPVKPRTGPPRQGPPPPGMRGPPVRAPMGPNGVPQPRPLSPAGGRNSPHPPGFSPNNGRMSPGPRAMSPGPRQMSPHMQGPPRGRSNSNAPYAGPPRSMSPGPYGGGPQMAPPQMGGRPRSNSASQAGNPRRGPAPGPSPMNPNAGPMPSRKPVPGMAM
ncbi:hypothetical protein FB567DRAFT_562268 [Paraphoma chrysanthemicola]|uniref:SH3 domain-containing protein n=1 Tax=Paraphoma chrysanthemicola TaxID=798071 RepID=A0A8K0R082_9PLEO|nr:hypothetical protein FB567DRAFT_562268 [Paraphoma chrysanthemicola]